MIKVFGTFEENCLCTIEINGEDISKSYCKCKNLKQSRSNLI